MEEEALMPMQGWLQMVALIPKEGSTDERPITLVWRLCRLLLRIRKEFMVSWDLKWAGPWDEAVRGMGGRPPSHL
jgi:hypothetical protein